MGVGSDCDETSGTIKSTLQFDSSEVSYIKTEVIEKDDGKISRQGFLRLVTANAIIKSLNIADTKRSRKQDSERNIQGILAARVRTVFPVSHKDIIILCHFFLINLIRNFIPSVGFCRRSRVEGKKSKVEGNMS